jgi:hypothetical protein
MGLEPMTTQLMLHTSDFELRQQVEEVEDEGGADVMVGGDDEVVNQSIASDRDNLGLGPGP